MNPQKIKSAIKHYLFGLFASSWNGGIGAVAGIAGIGAANMSGVPGVHLLNGREMLSAFCGAFILHAVMWLKAHPIPTELVKTSPPIAKP
jgi:hypothetical protein